MTPLLVIPGALVAVTIVSGTVFFIGMRRNTPFVIDGVRRFGRAVTNPLVMRTAGGPGAAASRIEHLGRTSGRAYETPVKAWPVDGGFVIALPYGTRADWVRNVLASGRATIVEDGTAHEVGRLEVVPTAEVAALLPTTEVRTLRRFRVDQCLRCWPAAHR